MAFYSTMEPVDAEKPLRLQHFCLKNAIAKNLSKSHKNISFCMQKL